MINEIKQRKFKELIRRADISFSNAAIEDILKGVENAKKQVDVKSCLQLDLVELNKR